MKIAYYGIILALVTFVSCTIEDTIPERNTLAPSDDIESSMEKQLAKAAESSESEDSSLKQEFSSSEGEKDHTQSIESKEPSSNERKEPSSSSISSEEISSSLINDKNISSSSIEKSSSQKVQKRSSSSEISSSESSSSLEPLSSSQEPTELSGTINIHYTTVTYDGKYSMSGKGKGFVFAVYVLTEDGSFIKTLNARGEEEEKHLVNWMNSLGDLEPDGISGATTRNHREREISWDLKNRDEEIVTPGTYTVYFEFTEDNKDGDEFRGRIHSVEMDLNGDPFLIEESEDNFKDISIVYSL
ncbi:MAG: DUF2271 domain-containing protein [Fibrobacterales bacterium]